MSIISDEELDRFRVEGIKVRVVRDADPANDIRGIIVAWDDDHVLVRRPNRRVVKLSRHYVYQSARDARPDGAGGRVSPPAADGEEQL